MQLYKEFFIYQKNSKLPASFQPGISWSTDITYIPMRKGFMYLCAVIDVHTRYVVNWSLSNVMTADWCLNTIQEAMRLNGKPEIVNTDQGSQFTSNVFTGFLENNEIKISMVKAEP